MPFGARFEGDNGQLVLDETLSVFQILEEGAIGPIYQDITYEGGSFSYMLGFGATFKRTYAKTPLVVLFPPAGGGACWISGGSVTPSGCSMQCKDGFAFSYKHGPFQYPNDVYGVRYAVISDEIPESNERFGMRLWDEDARLIYDSGYPLAYFRGFGISMNYWYPFQTRNDNKLEAFIFVHRVPIPDAECGVILNTLPFCGDTYAPKAGPVYFGWRAGDRANFGVGVQGPPGFSSGSQSVGDATMYIQSVLFVSR